MSDVTAVRNLDLARYLGRWYEICRLPLKYEDVDATDITANYSLNDDGTVRVDNRCFNGKGEPTQAVGQARPVDETCSRLKVNFLPASLRWLPFTDGDYWVLKIDTGYRFSLVATPDRKFLWVLARDSVIPQPVLDDYLAEARAQGFDLTNLITPRHIGREVSDSLLAHR